jgi:hypothetical protein
VYLGRGHIRPTLQASLVADWDVIVGPSGAAVQGAVLCGGRLHRLGTPPGRLDLNAETRFSDPSLPRRGLPLLPGTENRERIRHVRLISADDFSAGDS